MDYGAKSWTLSRQTGSAKAISTTISHQKKNESDQPSLGGSQQKGKVDRPYVCRRQDHRWDIKVLGPEKGTEA